MLLKYYYLGFCLIQSVLCGLFSSSIDKLKEKAKAAFKKKTNKGTPLNFWGHEPTEYPGANHQYKEENRAKWNLYYQCLEDQQKNVNRHQTVAPEAILGFETSFVTMECKICLSPMDSQDKESVVWQWAGPNDEVLTEVEFTEHILVTPESRTLQIFNLNAENSGQYVCQLGKAVVAPYFLTVVNISETEIVEVHNPLAPEGPYPKESETIEFNLILDTEWGEWSVCSKCNAIGRRHKLGYCNVYLNPTNGTGPSNQPVEEFFCIFKYGVPCQSHILPYAIRQLPSVKERKNEIMIGYCNEQCPEKKVFEIRDQQGNVLERADNSQGIYSLSQKLPPMEPTVDRKTLFEAKGKDIILECPGSVNSDAPIQWQIADKTLISEKIFKESNGRVYLSITDRVHIKKAKLSDSNVYSCWQRGELAGTIRLVVEKRFELNFNHTIMLFGIVLVLGTFLYVAVRMVANREYVKEAINNK